MTKGKICPIIPFTKNYKKGEKAVELSQEQMRRLAAASAVLDDFFLGGGEEGGLPAAQRAIDEVICALAQTEGGTETALWDLAIRTAAALIQLDEELETMLIEGAFSELEDALPESEGTGEEVQ